MINLYEAVNRLSKKSDILEIIKYNEWQVSEHNFSKKDNIENIKKAVAPTFFGALRRIWDNSYLSYLNDIIEEGDKKIEILNMEGGDSFSATFSLYRTDDWELHFYHCFTGKVTNWSSRVYYGATFKKVIDKAYTRMIEEGFKS